MGRHYIYSVKQIMKKSEIIFLIVVVISTTILFFLPTGYENPDLTKDMRYEKSKVLTVDNSGLRQISIVITGVQEVTLKIESGKFKGQIVSAQNHLLGQKNIDKLFKPGERAMTILQLNDEHNQIIGARAAEYYRQDLELLLFICFGGFLILFARYVGLKAILSFIFTALSFWKLLIPAFLNGYNPLLVSLSIVFICTLVIVLLVGGVNRKGGVALLGTMSGITITAILALTFGHFFHIPGTVQEFSEALLYTGYTYLDLSTIFISVIFISAAGAVMDVAMDISAAQHELISHTPNMARFTLMKSGLNIASPVIGSMTTTLLFAYSGSFMFAFMAFMAKGTPLENIVNKNYIAAEILHTLVGSFGLVLVAPLTAIIGAYVYTWTRKTSTLKY